MVWLRYFDNEYVIFPRIILIIFLQDVTLLWPPDQMLQGHKYIIIYWNQIQN